MAVVTDPNGTQWSVHRRWWPFPDLSDVVDFDWFTWLLAAPFLLLWPFWLEAKVLGARWRIVIRRAGAQRPGDRFRRGGQEMETELVRGWRRSGARIDEHVLRLAQGWRSGHYAI
ncbi:uncharacterized protein RMCC_5456 [Mycolicibacterium canariasense]|uniref:Uncharacterized protein n=1 Tax=Mycolicibacterium canariasense TaxID=228230 RepID=A0A100WI29_MYCCR|nr:hypothetical protein [Mycolicibacterium canariasense]MCV7213544.1 hypothetical protein [Mycolicibacterium canariasense]ORV15267.1 hypothetical protein AWB94_04200 [Mycolicibacterium canariasense]GAS98491.1 uncharacterized protein RMCC_5456 [Mycolicibacterium canariasense]